MIIVDPVTLGDATCTRASPKWVFDRNGVLIQVPANTLAVTYDPSDLSAAPYPLIEGAATNRVASSSDFTNAAWTKGALGTGTVPTITANAATAPDGTLTAQRIVMDRGAGTTSNNYSLVYQDLPPATSGASTSSIFLRSANGKTQNVSISGDGTGGIGSGMVVEVGSAWKRYELPDSAYALIFGTRGGSGFYYTGGDQQLDIYAWGSQIEDGLKATSYTPSGAPRVADVIGSTAGLIYSNVAETVPLWAAGTSYAAKALVRDAAHNVYESLVDGNAGNDPVDPLNKLKWLKTGVTNRRAMFDDRNNTQTTNAEEIVFVMYARAITQGLYLGNLDANEIRVSMTDLSIGRVYREEQNLIVSATASSFFRWCFNRIRRRSYFLTLKLPVFANALVTVAIKKPGGTPRCGMCMLGPAVDVGLSHYGLSTELKDYSTTTFNADGTSSTVTRGYSKRMSVDVSVENDRVESVEEVLIGYRQKTVVWVGATMRGDAMVCGKYSSFKKVIDSFPRSKMALQIEGVVS